MLARFTSSLKSVLADTALPHPSGFTLTGRATLCLLAATGMAAIMLACDKAPAPTPSTSSAAMDKPRHIKVFVQRDGTVLADGSVITLEALDQRLGALANDKVEVWYSRESPESEPHPNAMRIMELVIKHKLPVSMSSKPDFSDYVDDKGRSHPRP